MRHLVYDPKPNATPDEVLQVLKVFTLPSYPKQLQTTERLFKIYDELPPEAKRHFKVVEES